MKEKKIVLWLLFIASITLLITVGISYSFFSYVKEGRKENSVKIGSITFKYTENKEIGNGINIEDAMPISDEEGKKLNEEGQVFDFKVEANLSRSDLEYEVVAEIGEETTLPLEAVKLYLTEITEEPEKELLYPLNIDKSVKTLEEFQDTEITGATGKTIYQETILRNTRGYLKKFRVRMWLKEDLDWTDEKYMGKTISVRINVYANSDRSMAATETTNPEDIGIERILVNKKYLFQEVQGEEYQYSVTVPYQVKEAEIEVIPRNLEATVEVSKIGSESLEVGDNFYKIKVTSGNKEKTKEYIVRVVREKSKNIELANLEVLGYQLVPSYSSEEIKYTLEVPYETDRIEVKATKKEEKQKIEGEGNYQLEVGDNTIEVKVTAEDGVTNITHTIKVHRKSNDATLKLLSVEGYSLTPSFKSTTTTYSLTVPNSIDSITVKAEKNHEKASVIETEEKGLEEGENVITVQVTAENGNEESYTITVTRKKKEEFTFEGKEYTYTGSAIEADIASATSGSSITYTYYSSIDCSGEALSGAPTDVGNYSVKAESSGNSNYESGNKCVAHTITKGNPTITLTIKSDTYIGSAIEANTASAKNPNGSVATLTYTYTYYSSTDCSGIALSGAPTDVGNYSVKATSAATSNLNSGNKCVTHTITKGNPTVSLTAKSAEATGSAIEANTASAKNPNGSVATLTYTYTYYSSTDCSGIALSGAPIDVGNYSVKATSAATSNLNSENKCATHTITENTNNNLSSLSISGYSISPTFSSGTQTYTATTEATSITVNATAAGYKALVLGIGSKTLSWGSNEISVIVTSQSGAVKMYKITVDNQRPTAPEIQGGGKASGEHAYKLISIKTAGSALSGINHYEYYTSTTDTEPNATTTATGTTSGYLAVDDEGTTYIWYRTVSNNGNKSVWTGPQVTLLDATAPTTPTFSNKVITDETVTLTYNATDSESGIIDAECYYGDSATTITQRGTKDINNKTCTFPTTTDAAYAKVCVKNGVELETCSDSKQLIAYIIKAGKIQTGYMYGLREGDPTTITEKSGYVQLALNNYVTHRSGIYIVGDLSNYSYYFVDAEASMTAYSTGSGPMLILLAEPYNSVSWFDLGSNSEGIIIIHSASMGNFSTEWTDTRQTFAGKVRYPGVSQNEDGRLVIGKNISNVNYLINVFNLWAQLKD